MTKLRSRHSFAAIPPSSRARAPWPPRRYRSQWQRGRHPTSAHGTLRACGPQQEKEMVQSKKESMCTGQIQSAEHITPRNRAERKEKKHDARLRTTDTYTSEAARKRWPTQGAGSPAAQSPLRSVKTSKDVWPPLPVAPSRRPPSPPQNLNARHSWEKWPLHHRCRPAYPPRPPPPQAQCPPTTAPPASTPIAASTPPTASTPSDGCHVPPVCTAVPVPVQKPRHPHPRTATPVPAAAARKAASTLALSPSRRHVRPAHTLTVPPPPTATVARAAPSRLLPRRPSFATAPTATVDPGVGSVTTSAGRRCFLAALAAAAARRPRRPIGPSPSGGAAAAAATTAGCRRVGGCRGLVCPRRAADVNAAGGGGRKAAPSAMTPVTPCIGKEAAAEREAWEGAGAREKAGWHGRRQR